NVKHQKCKSEGCTKQPAVALEGDTKQYSAAGMVDIKNKRCESKGCTLRAYYGFAGTSKTHCLDHVLKGQVLIKRLNCVEMGCRERATHGIKSPLRCEAHSLPSDQDLVQKVCVSCNLPEILDRNGKCGPCGDPEAAKKVRRGKHLEVKELLERHYKKVDWYDRAFDADLGCSGSMPDILYDHGTHVVIPEVDEHQHRDRNQLCECTRMTNIVQMLRRPTVFVRYNPDSFKRDGVAIRVSMAKRIEVLIKWLRYFEDQGNVPHTLQVIQLFYNEYDEQSVKIHEIPTL
ncbi:unnamed protein product, partial [Phaeothamnion confervicola]